MRTDDSVGSFIYDPPCVPVLCTDITSYSYHESHFRNHSVHDSSYSILDHVVYHIVKDTIIPEIHSRS